MKTITAVLMMMVLAWSARAERIGLRNGQQIEGEVIRQTTGEIVVKTGAGVATYRLIELDESTVQRFLGTVTNPAVVTLTPTRSPEQAEDFVKRFVVQAGILWSLAKVLAFVTWVWWIVAGFRASVVWGIAMLLFQPCANVFLLIFQWDHARIPFFLSLLTGALIAIPLVQFFV